MAKKILAVVIALYVLSGIYVVAPDQQAVLLRFGKLFVERVPPGIHYHLPYPIETIYKMRVYETKRVSIGLEVPDQVLGRTSQTKMQFFTGDQNLINIHLMVQYHVKQPSAYLFRAAEVTQLISNAAESSAARFVATGLVDDLLTTAKVELQQAVQSESQRLMDSYGAGVFLSSVNVESVIPPEDVAMAFRDVASARADRDRIINEAQSYANSNLPQARGHAYKLVQEAESYKQKKVNEARGDADRFIKFVAEYSKNQELTSARLYLEAVEEILPKLKKVIIDSNGSSEAIDLSVIQNQE